MCFGAEDLTLRSCSVSDSVRFQCKSCKYLFGRVTHEASWTARGPLEDICLIVECGGALEGSFGMFFYLKSIREETFVLFVDKRGTKGKHLALSVQWKCTLEGLSLPFEH